MLLKMALWANTSILSISLEVSQIMCMPTGGAHRLQRVQTTSNTRSKPKPLALKTWTNSELISWHWWPAASGLGGWVCEKKVWLASLRTLWQSKPNTKLLLVVHPWFCSSEHREFKIVWSTQPSSRQIHHQSKNMQNLYNSWSYRKVPTVELLHRAAF